MDFVKKINELKEYINTSNDLSINKDLLDKFNQVFIYVEELENEDYDKLKQRLSEIDNLENVPTEVKKELQVLFLIVLQINKDLTFKLNNDEFIKLTPKIEMLDTESLNEILNDEHLKSK